MKPKNLDAIIKNIRSLRVNAPIEEPVDATGSNLFQAHLGSLKLVNINFRDANLSEADFSGNKVVADCDFTGADFIKANVAQTIFEACHFSSAKFGQSTATKAIFRKCALEATDFSAADLLDASFLESSLSGSNFDCTNLFGTKFEGNLQSATFRHANIQCASFAGADLAQADFTGARIAEGTFFDALGLDQLKADWIIVKRTDVNARFNRDWIIRGEMVSKWISSIGIQHPQGTP